MIVRQRISFKRTRKCTQISAGLWRELNQIALLGFFNEIKIASLKPISDLFMCNYISVIVVSTVFHYTSSCECLVYRVKLFHSDLK